MYEPLLKIWIQAGFNISRNNIKKKNVAQSKNVLNTIPQTT